jgi:hypothetical protein
MTVNQGLQKQKRGNPAMLVTGKINTNTGCKIQFVRLNMI